MSIEIKCVHIPFVLPGDSASRNILYGYSEMCTKKYVTWIFDAVLFVIEKDGKLLKYASRAMQWNTS